jgi:insertion element IS1 protein InsB
MRCHHCSHLCNKAGYYPNQEQRYKCITCNKYQKQHYTYTGCNKHIDQQIVLLTNEGCGIRSISRILNISTNKVLQTIRKIAKQAQYKSISTHREYELDEMCTYIKTKTNLYWVVYAIDRETRVVVAFKVGKRNNKTLKFVIDTLLFSKAKKIYTDKLKQYRYLIPDTLHDTTQYKTNRIERKNLSIRTHLKRLSRRTLCFSKSKTMLESCLSIYFWRESDVGFIF